MFGEEVDEKYGVISWIVVCALVASVSVAGLIFSPSRRIGFLYATMVSLTGLAAALTGRGFHRRGFWLMVLSLIVLVAASVAALTYFAAILFGVKTDATAVFGLGFCLLADIYAGYLLLRGSKRSE